MSDGNIYRLFEAAAAMAGERPCLIEGGEVLLSYATLDAKVSAFSAALGRAGAKPGDRLVAQVEKSPEAVLLYLACVKAGLIYVPLNTAYTPAEVGYFLGDAEPAIFVCDPAREAALRDVAGEVPTVLTLGPSGEGSLAERVAQGGAASIPTLPRDADDIACILYTSGTTGRSKGAMLSHGNLSSNALTLKTLWGWREGDVLLHALPIYHVHGLFVALHGALLNGSPMLFHRKFEAAAVLADLAQATVMMGVPTFYTRLLDQPGLTRQQCAAMRLFISGSAPLLASTFEAFEARTGHRILERYGMTEAGMITSNPYDGERIAGTVGYALPGVSVRLGTEDGSAVPPGEPGVLEIKGPNLFRGYWRMPEKTAEEHRADGYFITGDVATIAADGRVSIVGRAKDLIISGGFNVYPKEIELLVDALPGVAESAVIGIPHRDLGEAVVAVVVAEAGYEEDQALATLGGQLARFKTPRRIVTVDQLPRNAMGKVQKALLRERFAGLFGQSGVQLT
jgi:malonyl-CoA/methylmalonyl-CoA synthetase